MTVPSSVPETKVNWWSIAAFVIGVVSIFINPYLLVSVIAIVLGIFAIVSARRAGNQRSYQLIGALGIAAGVFGAVLVIISNTISASV